VANDATILLRNRIIIGAVDARYSAGGIETRGATPLFHHVRSSGGSNSMRPSEEDRGNGKTSGVTIPGHVRVGDLDYQAFSFIFT
jgi:hypothetical protein